MCLSKMRKSKTSVSFSNCASGASDEAQLSALKEPGQRLAFRMATPRSQVAKPMKGSRGTSKVAPLRRPTKPVQIGSRT